MQLTGGAGVVSRLALALALTLGASAGHVGCGEDRPDVARSERTGERASTDAAAPSDERGWPFDDAADISPRPLSRPVRLVLDPGHGAKDNRGNTGSFGALEEDFTLALAYDVEAALEARGSFEVVLTRQGSARVAYADRVALADALRADAFVSLHSDVRGKAEVWEPSEGLECKRSEDAPGFTVLFSDEGAEALVTARRRLGASIASSMLSASFSAYGGEEYEGLYEHVGGERGAPGLFVDRHLPDKRIFVLRRPKVPSVIVETHNALDPREATRWEDDSTRHAFALALADALAAFVAEPAAR